MLRRLRQAAVLGAHRTPYVALWSLVFCAFGLGLHAARNWHHHGELSAGFFHLHQHIGGHDHDHAGAHHHDHGGEAPESPDDRKDPPSHYSRFFSVAGAATGPDASSWIARPEMLRHLRDDRKPLRRVRSIGLSPSSPRAPPA